MKAAPFDHKKAAEHHSELASAHSDCSLAHKSLSVDQDDEHDKLRAAHAAAAKAHRGLAQLFTDAHEATEKLMRTMIPVGVSVIAPDAPAAAHRVVKRAGSVPEEEDTVKTLPPEMRKLLE